MQCEYHNPETLQDRKKDNATDVVSSTRSHDGVVEYDLTLFCNRFIATLQIKT